MMSVGKWLRRKIRGINQERMKKHIEIIAKNNNKSKMYVFMDMVKNFITRGSGYTDYFRGDYINLTKNEKKTFVTAKSFYKIIAYLNPEKYQVLLKDKMVFNNYFKEFIKRDFIDLREVGALGLEKFIKGKSCVFAKQLTGESGHGITKIAVSDIQNIEALYQKLIDNKQYLVEDEIKQCKELNEINPHVVNSFRVITLYKDGEVTILNTALRVNQDEANVIGSTNDLYFSLGEDGKINSNVIDDYANVYTEHPLTKKKFKDVVIPGVDKAFLMCKEAALKVPNLRYIGWDVAFTDKGPLIVEGNEYPGYGLVQFYKLKNSKTGHLKEISDVLGDEMKNIKL